MGTVKVTQENLDSLVEAINNREKTTEVDTKLSGKVNLLDIYYNEVGSYGLVWDQTADSYTRVGDNNYTRIQSKLRRCILDSNGQVAYYLHPNNSTLKEDGTAADLTGSDGNVMVEVPLTYLKYIYSTSGNTTHTWEISDKEDEGFEPHACFVVGGEVKNYRYYPAYLGTVIGTKLMSVSGQYPTVSKTREQFRSYAKANGDAYHQIDFLLYEFITLLAIIEYGTMNIQSALGQGRTALTGGSWVGGSLIGINGLSNKYGNGSANYTYSGDAGDSEADYSFMSYRGCENLFGNIWRMVDGINIREHVAYISQNPSSYQDDVFNGDYISTGVTMSVSNGYTRQLGNSSNGFFPTSVSGGSATVGTTDYYYQAAGDRIALVGGHAANGLNAGPLYLSVYHAASISSILVGSGVSV